MNSCKRTDRLRRLFHASPRAMGTAYLVAVLPGFAWWLATGTPAAARPW